MGRYLPGRVWPYETGIFRVSNSERDTSEYQLFKSPKPKYERTRLASDKLAHDCLTNSLHS